MKNKLLIIGIVFLLFGLSNLVYVFGFYAICCDQMVILLVPFGGTLSGSIPQPFMEFLTSNEYLENISIRLGSGGTFAGFNDGWPFSFWELFWSLSFYVGIILLLVLKIK